MASPHLTFPVLTAQQVRYFWGRVNALKKNGCWEWMAGKSDAGYGVLTVSKREYLAHRVAYFLAFGEYVPSLCVLHRCDNPPCCNPQHLFLGTFKDNTRDMLAKGRHNRHSRFTIEFKTEIQRRYAIGGATHKQLAREFGLSTTSVHRILKVGNGRILSETYAAKFS